MNSVGNRLDTTDGTTIGTNLSNLGTLEIGDSPGQLSVTGSYQQSVDGILEIEIGGTTPVSEHDFLSVMGLARLAGTLEVSLIDGFVPEIGDNFGFLMSDVGFAGMFNTLNLPDLGDGKEWLLNPGGSTLFLEVRSALEADVDGDGDVDGQDFLLIQRNDPSLIPAWELEYGTTSPPVASQAVPEPSVAVLLLWGVSALGYCRVSARVHLAS